MPPVITLNHPKAYEVWIKYMAFGGRFLPSQLLKEDDALLDDMLTLSAAYEAVKKASEKEE